MCIAHIVQSLTDVDSNATVVSIDGVGAYDLISRNSMLRGLSSGERRSDPPLRLVFLRTPQATAATPTI